MSSFSNAADLWRQLLALEMKPSSDLISSGTYAIAGLLDLKTEIVKFILTIVTPTCEALLLNQLTPNSLLPLFSIKVEMD